MDTDIVGLRIRLRVARFRLEGLRPDTSEWNTTLSEISETESALRSRLAELAARGRANGNGARLRGA